MMAEQLQWYACILFDPWGKNCAARTDISRLQLGKLEASKANGSNSHCLLVLHAVMP